MHRLDIGAYAGEPDEQVSLTTDVHGGGAVTVALDGQIIDPRRTFRFKSAAGEQSQLRITLFGTSGDSCVVGISPVDGGVDGDLLVCQPHDPAPVHLYRFIVVAPAAMTALRRIRSGL